MRFSIPLHSNSTYVFVFCSHLNQKIRKMIQATRRVKQKMPRKAKAKRITVLLQRKRSSKLKQLNYELRQQFLD